MKTKITFALVIGLSITYSLCAQSPSPAPTIDTSAMSPEQKQVHLAMEIDSARSELRHALLHWQAIMKTVEPSGKKKAMPGEKPAAAPIMPPDEVKRVQAALNAYGGK